MDAEHIIFLLISITLVNSLSVIVSIPVAANVVVSKTNSDISNERTKHKIFSFSYLSVNTNFNQLYKYNLD